MRINLFFIYFLISWGLINVKLHLTRRGRWWSVYFNGNKRVNEVNTRVKIWIKLQFGHFFILNKKNLKHKQFNNVNNFSQYTQVVKEKNKSPLNSKFNATLKPVSVRPRGCWQMMIDPQFKKVNPRTFVCLCVCSSGLLTRPSVSRQEPPKHFLCHIY